MPVAINPNAVRSQTESGCSNPYMPITNPEAIATMPTDRAMNALCRKPEFPIASGSLIRGVLHRVDKVIRRTETIGRDAAEFSIMHDDLLAQ
jgi:hypothetical protein